MNQRIVVSRSRATRLLLAAIALLGLASALVIDSGSHLVAQVNSMNPDSLPNNLPHPNPGGKAATFSTQGSVN